MAPAQVHGSVLSGVIWWQWFNSLLLSFGLLALLLLALTRGRLGYQHYRQEVPDSVTAQPEEGIPRTPFI